MITLGKWAAVKEVLKEEEKRDDSEDGHKETQKEVVEVEEGVT